MEGEIFSNVKNIIYNGLFPDRILAVIGGDLSSSKLYLPNATVSKKDYELWKGFFKEIWRIMERRSDIV